MQWYRIRSNTLATVFFLRLSSGRPTRCRTALRSFALRPDYSMMSTDATSTRITVSPENTGLWGLIQSDEAAARTSELLEKDLNVR